MLKLIGSIMLILSGTAVGYMASHRLSMRVAFLNQYIKFMSFCETQIRFSAIPIIEILKRQQDSPYISSFIKNCIKKMETNVAFPKAWVEATNEISKDTGLTTEDINLIKDFGISLGESDIEGQISHCRLNIKLMNDVLDSAIEDKKKKGRIYIMLGLFSGVAIVLAMC